MMNLIVLLILLEKEITTFLDCIILLTLLGGASKKDLSNMLFQHKVITTDRQIFSRIMKKFKQLFI